MSEPQPSDLAVSPRRGSFWRNLSPVWLVPLLAVVVSLGIAWQAYSERGVAIEIAFPNAAGVLAGETTVRYRDVVIGTVEEVGFSNGLTSVVVTARIDKHVAPYLDEDAAFWVVRPEVSTRGISGLGTVLSGVYIEGDWDDAPGTARESFEGLDRAPLTRPGRAGTRITLRTEDARSITAGAPILFQGIQVGVLETPRLVDVGDSILVDGFIEAPHDRRLSSATRFWDASGFSVSLGPGGISLDVDSLSSLVSGGLEFASIYQGGEPIEDGFVFEIFPDEATARRTAFTRTIVDAVKVSVAFEESVDGLAPGADLRYGGLRVGQVDALAVRIEELPSGPEVRLVATLAIDPALLGLPDGSGADETLTFLEEAVADGLRARLAAEGLLSGSLVVELVEVRGARPAVFDRAAEPFPVLPTAPSELPNFTATAEDMLQRIESLPIEEVLDQAVRTMQSIELLAADDGLRAAPDAAVALIDEARGLIADPELRAIPADLRAAVADLRAVVGEVRAAGAVEGLTAALASVEAAAAGLTAVSEGVPPLVEDLRALTAKATELPTEAFLAAATGALRSTEALIGSEDARALPPALTAALGEMRTTLAALNEGDAAAELTAALQAVDRAAADFSAASEGVPALIEELRALTAKAGELPTEELMAAATNVMESADALIDTDGARDLPPALAAALDEVRETLAALNDGEVVANANATMASARDAADSVAAAAEGLPELSRRLEALVARGEALVGAYAGGSAFNDETLDMLRDVQEAARAVTQLSRAIERNPNSLILGR